MPSFRVYDLLSCVLLHVWHVFGGGRMSPCIVKIDIFWFFPCKYYYKIGVFSGVEHWRQNMVLFPTVKSISVTIWGLFHAVKSIKVTI